LGLFVSTSCSWISSKALIPEDGQILYALLETQTDYIGADSISFEIIPSVGGEPQHLSLTPQIKPGWQSATEYFKPQCPQSTHDGRFVAFNDERNITIYDFLENKERMILLNYDLVLNVALSPDGSEHAFAGNPEVGQSNIWFYDLKTGSLVILVECESCQSPTWHPDGNLLAYADIVNQQIVVVDISQKTNRSTFFLGEYDFNFVNEGQILAWSPDGDNIAVSVIEADDREHVLLMTAATGEFRQISFGNDMADSPTWSPSGNQLLYRSVEYVRQVLPSEEPHRAVTNLVIVSMLQSGKYEITHQDSTKRLITCPQWVEEFGNSLNE
jgi:Tol biopolymer transport system component